MKTKLIRVYETDYDEIMAIRRQMVMQDGVIRSTAETVAHVLAVRNEILYSPEFQQSTIERPEY